MSASPAENPVPGVVTFTAHGNAALDQLADALAECDGSPASIADILDQVLQADIEDLAGTLSETAQPADEVADQVVQEVGPAVESPDEAARRRLGARMSGAAGMPRTRGFDVDR
jgi:hypothetical protein